MDIAQQRQPCQLRGARSQALRTTGQGAFAGSLAPPSNRGDDAKLRCASEDGRVVRAYADGKRPVKLRASAGDGPRASVSPPSRSDSGEPVWSTPALVGSGPASADHLQGTMPRSGGHVSIVGSGLLRGDNKTDAATVARVPSCQSGLPVGRRRTGGTCGLAVPRQRRLLSEVRATTSPPLSRSSRCPPSGNIAQIGACAAANRGFATASTRGRGSGWRVPPALARLAVPIQEPGGDGPSVGVVRKLLADAVLS